MCRRSTPTPGSRTRGRPGRPTSQTPQRAGGSWSCWRRPSVRNSSSLWAAPPPADGTTSSPGTIFTTKHPHMGDQLSKDSFFTTYFIDRGVIYWSTVLNYNFEVLVLYLSISQFCYIVLLPHYNTDVNGVVLLHYMDLIPLVTLQGTCGLSVATFLVFFRLSKYALFLFFSDSLNNPNPNPSPQNRINVCYFEKLKS